MLSYYIAQYTNVTVNWAWPVPGLLVLLFTTLALYCRLARRSTQSE